MISFSHQTDTGRKRDHNEDFYDFDRSLGLYVMCDGMGGHAAGEVASELACQSTLEFLRSKGKVISSFRGPEDHTKRKRILEILKEAILYANKKVYDLAMNESDKRGMGTTIVAMILSEFGVFVGHVGDSRAYIIRSDKVLQLTEDHSLVNELVKSGTLTKEQAMNHPKGNVITQALGIQEAVQPDVVFYELMEGDTLFSCSDGFHDYYNEAFLLEAKVSLAPEALASEMVKYANRKGGKDNITCLCFQIGEAGAPPAHPSQITVASKIETLKKIPLFASLNHKELSLLLEIIQIRKVEANTYIVEEGHTGEDMFVILKGEVGVFYREQMVNKLGPGQFFGEMALIDKSPRSATIKSLGPSKLMRIVRSEFFPLLKREPRIGLKVFWAFLQNMNKRLRDNDKKVFEMHQDYLQEKERTGTFDLSTLDK